MIKTMQIGDFKAQFSEVTELLKKGVTIKVIKGKAGELVGYFGKEVPSSEKRKRSLGFFKDKGIKVRLEDLQWSDEELEQMGL